jgi:hypothetical protein
VARVAGWGGERRGRAGCGGGCRRRGVATRRGPRASLAPSAPPPALTASPPNLRSTADGGARAWRVWRDDDYISGLLGVLGALTSDHVSRGEAPLAGKFASLPRQAPLLSRTAALARGAEVVAEAVAAPAGGGGGGGSDAAGAPGPEFLLPPVCADGSNAAAFLPSL